MVVWTPEDLDVYEAVERFRDFFHANMGMEDIDVPRIKVKLGYEVPDDCSGYIIMVVRDDCLDELVPTLIKNSDELGLMLPDEVRLAPRLAEAKLLSIELAGLLENGSAAGFPTYEWTDYPNHPSFEKHVVWQR